MIHPITAILLLTLWLSLGGCTSNTAKTSEPEATEIAASEDPAETLVVAPPPLPDPVGLYRAERLAGDYADYASAHMLIRRMVEEHDYEEEYLFGLFTRVERQQGILDLVNRPRGKGKSPPGSWNRYRKKFLTDTRILKGEDFWYLHRETLERAEDEYGVPIEYIVAIIGVETNYGRNVGTHSVLEALTTLAFDYPRRSEFFTSELEHFLVMARQQEWDPLVPTGSYAGAMGLGQFMPSSFHAYAVDFDGDGRKDLWNPVDAIGSVANYFNGHGWRSGEPVAFTARANSNAAGYMEAGFSSRYSPSTLQRNGIVASAPLSNTSEVSLLRFSTYSGPEYWVGLNNFYVITRYNHSSYYAMAVHQLAQVLNRNNRHLRGPVLSLEIGRPLAVN